MIGEQIIQNMNEIIGNNKASENVYTTFEFAEKTIQKKEVIFEINPKINAELDTKMTTSIMGGMYFRKIGTDKISIVFGKKYLDTYNKNSSVHHTVFIHECKHLYDYYQNKTSYFNSNLLQRFHYEIEATNIEAEFIKYYLSEKYTLTKCEKYILNSYENDKLESWTIAKRKESADIYRIIKDLQTKNKNNTISKDQLVMELIQNADNLLEKANQFLNLHNIYNEKDNFSHFAHFIRLKTFIKYIEYIFNDISELEKLLKKYNDFKNRLNNINNLLLQHDQANHLYSLSLDKYFEDDFDNGY
jgi:hypothetical protein